MESEISNFDALDAIFRELGYSVKFRYEKYRTEFQRKGEPGVATLDETPIGTFLELEGAAAWIDQVAEGLGFGERDYITASYGTLFMEHSKASGSTSGMMVFQEPQA
jgi:adenylate cyclase class 2